MKHRHGFVSNSSSSSFIIALPKKPDRFEQLEEMICGVMDSSNFRAPYIVLYQDINVSTGVDTESLSEVEQKFIDRYKDMSFFEVVITDWYTSGEEALFTRYGKTINLFPHMSYEPHSRKPDVVYNPNKGILNRHHFLRTPFKVEQDDFEGALG